MFSKRTIRQKVIVTSVDTASEALALSLAEKTKVDMLYMCELTGKSEEEIAEELRGVIFLNPLYGYGNSTEPKYLPADEYLSGNIREKLEWAKRSTELYPADYTVNVQALEQVMPTDLTASEISVRLGSTWLPVDDMFLEGYTTTQIKAYLESNGVLTRQGKTEWNREVIHSMLKNEKYVGDVIYQKSFRSDPISKHVILNRGQKDKYLISNNHPAIIDRDTFMRVQTELAKLMIKSFLTPRQNALR